MNGEGADLDDFLPLMTLTQWQINEWVNQSANFNFCLHCTLGAEQLLWAFYDSLKPEQKKQASSAAGVRLYRHDLERLIAAWVEREALAKITACPETKDKWWEQTADAGLVTGVTLRLKTVETSDKKLKYSLEISGKRGLTPFVANVSFGQPFPAYSDKREQELRKAEPPAK